MKTTKLSPLTAFLVLITGTQIALAQQPVSCPHAILRLDTKKPVDAKAICNAAKVWEAKGVQVFIFITDYNAPSEQQWFTFIDQAESKTGMRDLSQADAYLKNGFSLLATTNTSKPWGYNLTLGERLKTSPLRQNRQAVDKIKTELRNKFAANQITQGVVNSLNIAYQTNYPTPPKPAPIPKSQTTTSLPPQPVSSPTPTPTPAPAFIQPDVSTSLPWEDIAVGSFLALGMAGSGTAAFKILKRQNQLKAQLKTLQQHSANLMMACEELLGTETPQQAFIYQLFCENGGEFYPELTQQVTEWVTLCQTVLKTAFNLQYQLTNNTTTQQYSLEQQVQNWETFYISLTGNQERILSLTDTELRALLNPALTLECSATSQQLIEQLEQLNRHLEGSPLKVELMFIDPRKSDAEGMLGYIDQIKSEILQLQQAKKEAPVQLKFAFVQRDTTVKEIPPKFLMTPAELFAGIDQQLQTAQQSYNQGLHLTVLEQTKAILHHISIVKSFVKSIQNHHQRQNEINQIITLNYRPETLTGLLQEIKLDIENIRREITTGTYQNAVYWIQELNQDSQQALSDTQAWKTLHHTNTQNLAQLEQNLTQLEQLKPTALQAWQTLQTYPQSNWTHVADGFTSALQNLQQLRQNTLSECRHLNSLEQQKLSQVQQQLTLAFTTGTQIQQHFENVIQCLKQVQHAEKDLPQQLQKTEAQLNQLIAFRNRENAKIEPEVDRTIETITHQLMRAKKLASRREFFPAFQQQTATIQLIAKIYAEAQQQVQEINHLLTELDSVKHTTHQTVNRCLSDFRALPTAAQTGQAMNWVSQVERDFFNLQHSPLASSTHLEDRAWAKALQTEIQRYKNISLLANQAQQEIEQNRQDYYRYLSAAQNALNRANSAIHDAEHWVYHADADHTGTYALDRARRLLSGLYALESMSIEALTRCEQQALTAYNSAQEAEQCAHRQIEAARAARLRRQREEEARRTRQSSSYSSSSSNSSSSSSSRESSTSSSSGRESSMGESTRL